MVGTPTNVKCTVSGTTLNITWDAVSGALAYRVHVYKNVADDATCQAKTSGFTEYIVTTNSYTGTIAVGDVPICIHLRACSDVACGTTGNAYKGLCIAALVCGGQPACNLIVS